MGQKLGNWDLIWNNAGKQGKGKESWFVIRIGVLIAEFDTGKPKI